MKNRNIQFKPTAGVLIPLLLACFAAVFISAPTPAVARDEEPFNGTVSGHNLSQSWHGLLRSFNSSCSIPETRTTWEPSPGPRNSFRGLAHLTRISVKIIFPTLAPLTGLRPTAMKSPALSRGTRARQKRRECTRTMKPRRSQAAQVASPTPPAILT